MSAPTPWCAPPLTDSPLLFFPSRCRTLYTPAESIDAKNDADSLVYSTEKSLMEHRAKLDEATIKEVEGAISAAKEAAAKEDADVEALKEAVSKLQTASMAIGKAVYAKGGSSGGEAGAEADATEATKAEGKEGEDKKEGGEKK